METFEITNDAPPIMRTKTINIEGADYIYTIKKDEKENEIIIQLSGEKNLINILLLCIDHQPKKL